LQDTVQYVTNPGNMGQVLRDSGFSSLLV